MDFNPELPEDNGYFSNGLVAKMMFIYADCIEVSRLNANGILELARLKLVLLKSLLTDFSKYQQNEQEHLWN